MIVRYLFTAILVFIVSGCSFHVGTLGSNQSGRTIADMIDLRLATYVRSNLPKEKVGKSTCPDSLDLSMGKVAFCSLPVGDNALPVRIVFATQGDMFGPKANLDGFIFDMDSLATNAKLLLHRSFAVDSVVLCGKPRIRLYKPGATFTCSTPGISSVATLREKVEQGGQLFTFRPAGIKRTARELETNRILARHATGDTTMVPGSMVATEIDGDLQDELRVIKAAAIPKIGAARCPAYLNLTGKLHDRCTVDFNGKPMRFDIRIDVPRGFVYKRIDTSLDKANLARDLQDTANQKLAAAGQAQDALIGCGGGVETITPPKDYPCAFKFGGHSGQMTVTVLDVSGHTYSKVTHEN